MIILPEKPKKTTIAIDVSVQKKLDKLKKGRDTYNDIVRRLVDHIADVYVEFILIDNELPHTHTVVFQLGEDVESLYHWNGKALKTITIGETQKLLRQSKPNIMITRHEAETFVGLLEETIKRHKLNSNSHGAKMRDRIWSRLNEQTRVS